MVLFRNFCFLGLGASVVLAAAVVPSSDKALTKRDSPCDNGPGWAPVNIVGSSDTRNMQCETRFGLDYTPISGIEVWRKGDKDGSRIAGIQFTYGSSGTSPLYGEEDTSKFPAQSLQLKPGETITHAVLYGNGRGEWLGHIHLETSGGQTFEAGRDTNGIHPYSINVGGGLLLGAVVTPQQAEKDGRQNIASLGFLFLGQPIDHITITDLKYDSDPTGTNSGIDPQNVIVGTSYNHADKDATYTIAQQYGVTSSHTFSQSTSFSFGGSLAIEVSAKIFEIGTKDTATLTWEVSHEDAKSTTDSTTTTITCTASGTVAPGKGAKVTGTYQTGKGVWNYDSTVTVYLKDGTTYQYQEKGKLTNIAYTECSTSWDIVNDPKSPSASSSSSSTSSSSTSTSSSSTSTSSSSSSTSTSSSSSSTSTSSSSTSSSSSSSTSSSSSSTSIANPLPTGGAPLIARGPFAAYHTPQLHERPVPVAL